MRTQKIPGCLSPPPSIPAGLTSGAPSCPLTKYQGQQFTYQTAVAAQLWQALQDPKQDSHARHTLWGPLGPFHLSPDPLDVGMHPLSDGVALSLEKTELLNQV